MKNVLCIAAHPDDEVLGCGATLAKHASNGDQVQVIIASEGIASRLDKNQAASVEDLKKLHLTAEKANQLLGVQKVHFLNFPDLLH